MLCQTTAITKETETKMLNDDQDADAKTLKGLDHMTLLLMQLQLLHVLDKQFFVYLLYC
jgi:hypothetical protein